jgi:hypothetical protein
MKNHLRVSVTAATVALVGFVPGCVTRSGDTALRGGSAAADVRKAGASPATQTMLSTTEALPDIGTRMPDGRVYAGLSMDTGKPSYIAPAGAVMPDGTVYAGLSPDTKKELYTTPADAPGVYIWSKAVEYCKTLLAFGHQDWRLPSLSELAVQFNNRADIGGFNETGRMENATGYYWSSLQVGNEEVWAQRFNDGFHEHPSKDINSSLRCVR